jgi:integrase
MGKRRENRSNLPPCVYIKHGAYYLVKGGKWTRIGSTTAEALTAHARLAGTAPGSTPGGLPALIWKVYEHKLPTLARSTAASYKACATKLADVFASFEPGQVTQRHVAQLKVDMSATPNMANETVGFLRQVYDFALEHQLVDSNPCTGIKRFEVNKRRRCPSDAELARIYAASGDRLQVIIKLLCLTGQRVGDVLRLRRDQLTEQGIRFKQQKTGAPLTIAWSTELREVVERAKTLSETPSLTLLAGRRGAAPHYRSVIEQWHAACAKAGVEDLHLHDLRAYAVTNAKRQGLDPRAVAGHASESMTARYIRIHDEPIVTGPKIGF